MNTSQAGSAGKERQGKETQHEESKRRPGQNGGGGAGGEGGDCGAEREKETHRKFYLRSLWELFLLVVATCSAQ